MEKKEVVRHRREGTAYLYEPTLPLQSAQNLAVEKLVKVYFAGSVEAAISALQQLFDQGHPHRSDPDKGNGLDLSEAQDSCRKDNPTRQEKLMAFPTQGGHTSGTKIPRAFCSL